MPVSISYEFDPCDLSKAKELHTTEVEGSYDKADSEDIRSIVDGIVGYKGNVHVAFGKILDGEFDSAKAVAEQIDVQIKQNYKQFPSADAAVQLMGRDNCANSDSYSQTKIDEAKLHLSSRLCDESEDLVRNNGTVILVLSDRNIQPGLLVIPAAMAVGAVQKRLVDQQLRCDSNIIVETGSVRDSHQYAVLLGLGATAIYPYLAFETIEQLVAVSYTHLTLPTTPYV